MSVRRGHIGWGGGDGAIRTAGLLAARGGVAPSKQAGWIGRGWVRQASRLGRAWLAMRGTQRLGTGGDGTHAGRGWTVCEGPRIGGGGPTVWLRTSTRCPKGLRGDAAMVCPRETIPVG